MSEDKKNEQNGVAKLRERFYAIKNAIKQSDPTKIKETFIKEDQKSKKEEKKIAKPRLPEADV